jgi:hypothetical protein
MRHSTLGPVLAVFMLVAVPALGDTKPFGGAELLTGRGIKPPRETQTVQFGLTAGTSPMSAVLGYVKDDLKNKAVQQCDAAGLVADCAATVNEAMNQLKQIPDSTWNQLQDAANMSQSQLDAALASAGVTDPYVRNQVAAYVASQPADQRNQALYAARVAATAENSVNLLMEPFVRVNTKYIEIGVSAPFMLRIRSGGTDANLGNFTLDLRSGGVWSKGAVSFGITGGLSTYLPTGTRTADASARADLFQAPKTMHQYLGFAPHLVLGMDLSQWMLLMLHVEYLAQIGVRDSPLVDSVHVFKYGIGTVLFPAFFVNVLAELNGLVPLANAGAFNVLYFTGGLQFKIFLFRLAIAVEAPVWTAARPDTTVIGGVPVGQLSKYNVLSRISFTF